MPASPAPPTTPSRPGPKPDPHPLLGPAGGLVAVLSWGSYLALARAGVNQGLHVADFLLLRFIPAALVILPFMLPRWPAIRAIGPWRILAVTTLIGPPFVLLAIAGYRFAPLAHGAVVQPVTVTVAVTLAAALFLHEPLTPQRAIGIAAALVGVALVGFGAHAPAPGAGPTWAGDLLFAAAGLLWAAFTLLMRRWNLDPLVTTGAVAIVSSLVVLPAFVLLDTPARLLALPAPLLLTQVVVQGVLSGVVALIAFGIAVQTLGAARAALFPAMVPAAAIIIGVPITGEWPTPLQTAGLMIATAGLLSTLLNQRR